MLSCVRVKTMDPDIMDPVKGSSAMSTEPDAGRTVGGSRFCMDEWAGNAHAFPFLAITPFERPDFSLARAFERHGTAVAVDVGRNSSHHSQILEALRPLCSRSRTGA